MKNIIAITMSAYLILFSLNLFSQERVVTDYRIGARDLIEINVFGLDELNTRVRVEEGGKITLPLLGEIEVEGFEITSGLYDVKFEVICGGVLSPFFLPVLLLSP